MLPLVAPENLRKFCRLSPIFVFCVLFPFRPAMFLFYLHFLSMPLPFSAWCLPSGQKEGVWARYELLSGHLKGDPRNPNVFKTRLCALWLNVSFTFIGFNKLVCLSVTKMTQRLRQKQTILITQLRLIPPATYVGTNSRIIRFSFYNIRKLTKW